MNYPNAEQVISAVVSELEGCGLYGNRQRKVFPLNPQDVMTSTGRQGRAGLVMENCKQLSVLLIYQHVLAYDCMGDCERQYKHSEISAMFGLNPMASKSIRRRACEVMAKRPELLSAYNGAKKRLREQGFRLFNDHKAFNPCQ